MTQAFLKPSEIVIGPVSQANPLTFVLPRRSYEQRALIFDHDDKRFAFLLDGTGDLLHHICECNGQNDWNGVLVPGVDIEVDPDSLYDGDRSYPPRGALIRHDSVIGVQTNYIGGRFAHLGGVMTLMTGLSTCASQERACFTRWRIVLGEGENRRILHSVDVA